MIKKLRKKPSNNLVIWFVVLFCIMIAYNLISNSDNESKTIAFSEFLERIETQQVSEVFIQGEKIEGVNKDGSKFYTVTTFYPKLIDQLYSRGVKIRVVPFGNSIKDFLGTILLWVPGLLFIGVWIYFMKSMQSGGGAMSFGKSKARLISDNKKVTFADVAGIKEAQEELGELVDFLRNPSKFQKLGARVPRGCLLVGSPGTGKTLLAKAIAGEAEVPFFTISGSDFVEMFVGVGASRVRDMFNQAKKQAPCILFIDEIDAVGRHRGAGRGNANDEREQTLNQILVEMDGFSENTGVIVIAATNRVDVLDKALLRPGRFDRQITVPMPDISGRKEILEVHSKKIPLAQDVDMQIIARGTPGFSGADLANLVNEAALLAAKQNKNHVDMVRLEEAKDKVMMGSERRSMIMTEEEKKLTAYHEGGHALVCIYSPASDPIHKATIIPRGNALGLVMRLPEYDKRSVTLAHLKADIAVALGGRIAEEMIFGKDHVTSGASSDISTATDIARHMVKHWGFSERIGTIKVPQKDGYGYEHVSENLSKQVDEEVRILIDEGYKTASEILHKNKDKLHKLAQALLEYETLSGTEVRNLILHDKSVIETRKESEIKNNETKNNEINLSSKS